MGKQHIEVNYDKNEDILVIFKKDQKVKFSLDVELPKGDIVVDFGGDGQVIGLEFFNFSEYHPEIKIKEIEKVKANLAIQYGPNYAQINYVIIAQGKKVENGLISPYNKELILKH